MENELTMEELARALRELEECAPYNAHEDEALDAKFAELGTPSALDALLAAVGQ